MRKCASCGIPQPEPPTDWVYRPGEKYTAYFPGCLLCPECEKKAPDGETVAAVGIFLRKKITPYA
jgi:hypothetical protein